MKQIAIFITITIIGYTLGMQSGINPIDQSWFAGFTSFALVIGLYGSVSGIDLEAMRQKKRLAIIVVTIAVPIQIMATGAVMYLIHPVAVSFLLAVAITQIDPLSVDTLLQDKEKMSEEAKSILRVWASFDDPVTVLFGFLILMPLVSGTYAFSSDTLTYALGIAVNLLPALGVYALTHYTNITENSKVALALLVVLLGFAVAINAFLLAALLGLLLRPLPQKYLTYSVAALYYIIVMLVGMAIYEYGIDVRLALLLAMVEFFVIQPLTTIIVFTGTTYDMLRIAFSQQNGLTTLLMGIAFQTLGFEVLHIILPAIVLVNLINLTVNKIISWKEQKLLIT